MNDPKTQAEWLDIIESLLAPHRVTDSALDEFGSTMKRVQEHAKSAEEWAKAKQKRLAESK